MPCWSHWPPRAWLGLDGLRPRLVLLALTTLLPLGLFAVGLLLLFAHETRRTTERGMRETARALALALDREVGEVRAALGVLAVSRPLAAGDLAGFTQQCLEALRVLPPAAWLTLSDRHGQLLLDTRVPAGTPLPPPAALDVGRDVVATDRPSQSDLQVDPVTHQSVVTLNVPVLRDGQVEAVLSLTRPAATFGQLFREQQLPPSWIAGLNDRQHRILARSHAPERFIGARATPRMVERSAAAAEGWFPNRSQEGTLIYTAFSRVRSTGWTMVLFVPAAVVEAPGRRFVWWLVSGGLVLSAVGVGGALWLGRRIAVPIQALVPATQALVQGWPVPPAPAGAVREVQAVAAALHAAAALLQQREAALYEQRELLQTTLASIGDAVLTTDAAGRLTFANATAQALLRWPAAELLGQPLETVFRIINEFSRAPVESPGAKVLRDGTVVGLANHTLLLARDGTAVPIDDSAAPIRDRTGNIQGTVLVFRDITERRRAEETNRLLASIVASSEDAIISQDLHGVITSWNTAAERLYGYTAAEAIGQPMTLLAVPEHQEDMTQILECITRGERVEHYETRRRTKGGQVVQVSLTVSPIFDASGRIIGASKIARDMTQVRHLEEQLRHAQKLEALGTLAGGIAHDFNNLLAAILGYSELLQEEIPVGSPGKGWLQQVLAASLRAKALVQQILAFSRRTPMAQLPVSLAAMVRETLPFLRALLPSTIVLEAQLPSEPTLVLADATQMQQILMNLGANASDALGDMGGRLEIHLEGVEVDAAFAARHPALRPGSYVRLTVRDSGAGIPPDALTRIFEPFFTTKEVGRGTGLGLSVVYGIVESHGGAILVESTLGQGTTFTIYLPRLVERDAEVAYPGC